MKVFQILVLIFGLTVVGNAQLDCGWGIKLYVRGKSEKIIQNPKIKLIGSNVPHYYSTDNYHFWGEGMGTGVHGEFLLKVSADGYKNFEQIVKFPHCDIQILELRLKPENSIDNAVLERLTRLSGSITNQINKRIEGIKIVLTNKNGKRFENLAESGGYNFEIESGEYSIEFIEANNSLLTKVDKIKFEKETTTLNVLMKSDKSLSEQKTDLVCEHYSNEDESTWCELTVTRAK